MKTRLKTLGRIPAIIIATCLVLLGIVGVSAPAMAADTTGGYPYASVGGIGTTSTSSIWYDTSGNAASPYGYYYRNCTDFVAWKLSTDNGFSLPGGIGNGSAWGTWASSNHYVVNNTPSVGAVAWWPANASDNGYSVGSYGHVAWVSGVGSGSNPAISIEEYNHVLSDGSDDGAYHTRSITYNATSEQVQFIHFKDLSSGVGVTGIKDSSTGVMNVFENTTSDLRHYAESSGGSWNGEIIASGVSYIGSPSVFIDSNDTTHVFTNVSTGGLDEFTKSATATSWSGQVVSGTTFINSPSAFMDGSGNVQVFDNTSGGLDHFAQSSGSGTWGGEVVASTTFRGSPDAYLDGNTMQVYDNTSGGLDHFANGGGGWGGEGVASGNFINSPSVFKDSNGVTQVFDNTTTGLNHYANGGGGWGGEVVNGTVFTGSPSAFKDSHGNLEVYDNVSNGGLDHFANGGNGWGSEVVTSTPFVGAPSTFVDGGGTMQVFDLTGGDLRHFAEDYGSTWGSEIVS